MEQQAKHDLVRWALRIIHLERRIADQKRRAISEGGDMLGAFEVLQVMEQTLENWRAHNLLRHLY